MEYQARLAEILGPSRHGATPGVWQALEEELGASLPGDYKEFIDSYAPVRVNSHLHFDHPAHPQWNLGKWIEETVDAYREVEWDELTCPDFVSSEPSFGAPDGLVPLFGSDRGECFFFRPGRKPSVYVYVGSDDDFYRYDMTFSEWLYRYLSGEDMAGPNSSAFYPGPVRFDALPGAEGPEGDSWFGPGRLD